VDTAYEEFSKLTPAEKVFIATHPLQAMTIKGSKGTAFNETQKRFGVNGHNDSTDAFRHCFWSAILSRDIGYLNAWEFTTAHESDPNNPADEKKMDLHNNSVGLKIGNALPFFGKSNAELSNLCYMALIQGKLITSPSTQVKSKGY